MMTRYQSHDRTGLKRAESKGTNVLIYVRRFQPMLATVNVPVLAIVGERDRNVNWTGDSIRTTRAVAVCSTAASRRR